MTWPCRAKKVYYLFWANGPDNFSKFAVEDFYVCSNSGAEGTFISRTIIITAARLLASQVFKCANDTVAL